VRVAVEVIADVGFRAQQSLFLAAPQRETQRALRRGADRFENAEGLERDDRAVGVVGRTRPRMPGVQVRSHHDNLGF
jgi:hypothetical protein